MIYMHFLAFQGILREKLSFSNLWGVEDLLKPCRFFGLAGVTVMGAGGSPPVSNSMGGGQ